MADTRLEEECLKENWSRETRNIPAPGTLRRRGYKNRRRQLNNAIYSRSVDGKGLGGGADGEGGGDKDGLQHLGRREDDGKERTNDALVI
jgi:hypothetical protein